jgi:hypothetical protein
MCDPDFGKLVFMHISKFPERSYWECGWTFPKTGTVVWIVLRGGESGPMPEARRFYLSLPDRFEQILVSCRPRLEQVFKDWERPQLPEDIFSVVELTGFGLEDPTEQPVRWDVGFETRGDDWLGITIPFANDVAMEAVVDT